MSNNMDRQTLLDMIPAYALGALDDEDKRAVEQLLAQDEAAHQLLSEYQSIADALALGVPVKTPPPDLESNLRKQMNTRRWRPSPRQVIVALAAALALVIGGFLVFNRDQEETLTNKELYTAIAADPQAQRVVLIPDISSDIEGDLVYRSEANEAVIRVSNLPSIEADKAFQLWLIADQGAISGGVYRLVEQTNYIRVPLTQPLTTYTQLGVSIEPESGSPLGNRPTGPRVFFIPVPESHTEPDNLDSG